ncbi:unnamed protein product, partial [Medioppia subpectinata]
GESLAVYRGSGPPLGSGLHRYVFLVYKQLKPIVHSETILPTPGREGRTGFKVRDFAQKYKLGEPIAANFFVAQYDDYVGLRNARAKSGAKPTVIPTTRAAPIETTPITTTTTPPPEPVIEQQMEIEEEVMTDSPPPTERPTRTRTRSPMKGNRRSQLRDWTWTGRDWARKVAKKPKFPQMICMNYDTYKSIQSVLASINSSFKSIMDKHNVVPGVIDTVPKNIIKIHYSSGVNVNVGNELTPLSVKDEPTVQWRISDPDAGARAEIKHWLVVNIPGNDLSAGETLAEYRGSAPPAAGAPHRYIFLVYKQPSGRLNHSE